MSTSTTTNLSLIKEGGDEYIKTHRAHANANLDAVDTAIGNINSAVTALQNAITNANALLGTLGVDGNGDPLISAASARATLDAAQDNSSGITLADAGSNISTLLATTGIASTPSGKTLQGQISTLQDSVYRTNIVADCNTLTTPGFYGLVAGSTNVPTSGGDFPIIVTRVHLYVIQLAFGGASAKIWTRRGIGPEFTTWTAWSVHSPD